MLHILLENKLKPKLTLLALVCLLTIISQAKNFFIDPVNGSDSNPGSKQKPWKSLSHIFENNSGMIETRCWESLPYKKGKSLISKNTGAVIAPGDTIWLMDGFYGSLYITDCYNSGFITIAAKAGHKPKFSGILIRSSSKWAFKGLYVCPEYGKDKKLANHLVSIQSHGFRGPVEDVLVENCTLSSTLDSSQWTAEDWNNLSRRGIAAEGKNITVRGNKLKNVDFGINAVGSDCLVEGNVVENFSGDGLRSLGNGNVIQYNVVKNCYDVNNNHDDGFQSWARKDGGGEVRDVVLRGNTFINYEDPQQPHRGYLQAIGCFDGMYVNWRIENNVIITDHWHGITLMGAKNCTIINNTVIDPNNKRPGPPWIQITKHKDGRPSSKCLIRNNIAGRIRPDSGTKADHNIIAENLETLFVNASEYDLRLDETSPAINAGSSKKAPKKDIRKNKRSSGDKVDAGAYEFQHMQ
ncbi:right-handed parallel beta-helix repeat-containing protein [Sedimentisphaera salicampi]|uniref:right-handed parallel beta-helix repeat-containing protein n=1 Tax=Sedimentisphaera salicampi TaxID=1941349 RepID=UPI000B9D3EAC|nr:right-handed parallel beta-helix repeat-containing protein [Sedimentisphaera salicampi]OXU14990.1 hypothetical protein SMSP1_01183 [Sedimentisphaera salicampi]